MRIHPLAASMLLLALPLASPLAAHGQSSGDCSTILHAPLNSGGSLTIDSTSLGMTIEPAGSRVAQDTVQVSCSTDRSDLPQSFQMQLSGENGNLRLKVQGGSVHHGDLELHILVPERTNLRVRMPAGQITIHNVIGDKDCALRAGQITISQKQEWNYRLVDTSVDIGQLNAKPYGQQMGGFFRHFHANSSGGAHTLYVRVGTGQIDLLGGSHRNDGKQTSD